MPNQQIVLAQLAQLALKGVNPNGAIVAPDQLTEVERTCLELARQHERNNPEMRTMGGIGIVAMTQLSIQGERNEKAQMQQRLGNVEAFMGGLLAAAQANREDQVPARKVVGPRAQPKRLGGR